MNKAGWSARRTIKWVAGILTCTLLTLIIGGILIAASQDAPIQLLQSYLYSKWDSEPNSFRPPQTPTDAVREDGLRVRTNLRYAVTYPNSFLDVWYAPAGSLAKPPTVIFIHGGGWFMGDKQTGDPMAGAGPGTPPDPLALLAHSGLNVVSINYALAPAYRYPVPIIQLNAAIGYLRAHQSDLGVDMSNVVLMGGSAGAQMAAQYGLLLADHDYAAEVGVSPSIPPADVKALVLFSPPLRTTGLNWGVNAMLRAYLGTKDLEASKQAAQLNFLPRIGSTYPPTYITDGNQDDTFPEHAKAMAGILRKKGVSHVFNYYEVSEAALDHTYSGHLDTKHGRDNFAKAVAFIRGHTGLGLNLAQKPARF